MNHFELLFDVSISNLMLIQLQAATGLYKNVVERACWMSDLEIAHTAYKVYLQDF